MQAPNKYKNIKETSLLIKMKYVPDDPEKMHDFITFHDGSQLFKNKLLKVCQFLDMTEIQLDALFFFARMCELSSCSFKTTLEIEFKKNIIRFVNAPPELQLLINNEEFMNILIYNIGMTIVNESKFDIGIILPEQFNFAIRVLSKKNLGQATVDSAYKEKLWKINFEYFASNPILLQNFVDAINEIVRKELPKMINAGNDILDKCCDPNLSIENELELAKHVILCHRMVKDFQTDKILKNYYEYIEDLINEKVSKTQDFMRKWTDIFGLNGYNGIQNFGHINHFDINKSIQNTLTKIGMDYYFRNAFFMHGIDECFIEHNFFENVSQVADIVCDVLLNEKNTMGFTNKYDTTTLYDHFTIVTIGNDIPTNYEKEILYLRQNHRISWEFPAEILLRIFSRIFNTAITLYLPNLLMTEIDNTIRPNNIKHIIIFNYAPDIYYNIFPLGEKFIPANGNTANNYNTQDLSKSKHNTSDVNSSEIIEI